MTFEFHSLSLADGVCWLETAQKVNLILDEIYNEKAMQEGKQMSTCIISYWQDSFGPQHLGVCVRAVETHIRRQLA